MEHGARLQASGPADPDSSSTAGGGGLGRRKVQTNDGLAVVSDQVEIPSTCFFDFTKFKVLFPRNVL